jgi:hypothetical protein
MGWMNEIEHPWFISLEAVNCLLLILKGAFHESGHVFRQNYEEISLWWLAVARPLPTTSSAPYLNVAAHQVEIHPCFFDSEV